jgi:hypothetical protein
MKTGGIKQHVIMLVIAIGVSGCDLLLPPVVDVVEVPPEVDVIAPALPAVTEPSQASKDLTTLIGGAALPVCNDATGTFDDWN